jgi:hypothetical protein
MLDLSKARKWQSVNFFVGIRCRVAPVPEGADMEHIHKAVSAGILIDITEHPELFTPEKPIAPVESQDTGAKVYSGTRRFFRGLGVPDNDPKAPDEEVVSYASEDAAEQQRIEAELAKIPVVQAEPISLEEARQRARRPLVVLPPGMDDPERYLIRTPEP